MILSKYNFELQQNFINVDIELKGHLCINFMKNTYYVHVVPLLFFVTVCTLFQEQNSVESRSHCGYEYDHSWP